MNDFENIKPKRSISLYWKCQLIGWGLVSLFWFYIAMFRDDFQLVDAIINYFLDVMICIAITHAYRTIAVRRKWNQLDMTKLIWKLIPALLILSVLFMILMNMKTFYYIYLTERQNDSISELFVWNPIFIWNPVLITGLRHMTIWLLAYHLYHFYQREVQSTKSNAQLSLIAKQAQLDNLSAQLNPHFLFNSLNSIKSLVIENPAIARRGIDLLSDLLRSSLYQKDKDLITIREELALVKDYIELEKLRFEERLNIDITIDLTIETMKIPTLSIQLLVENAIKHGIDKIVEGGLITVKIYKKNDQIYIQVRNPGKLSVAKSSKGLGLMNLKKRLELQYNKEGLFRLEDLENNLVEATIVLPYIADENI